MKKKITQVVFILDKSGSMESCKKATVSGFNEYISSLKKDKENEYEFSLTCFNTEVEEKYISEPIKNIKPLNADSYNTDGGTALYDAACRTIERVLEKSKTGEKFLVVIMTDGEENASSKFTETNLREKIKTLEGTKNWKFVFMGANQDSWLTAQRYGFSRGNVANYNATDMGIARTFTMMTSNTSNFASSLNANDAFFSDSDRKNLEDTK